jgi:hypothetical protein
MGTSTTHRLGSSSGRTHRERIAHPAHRTMRRSRGRSGRLAEHLDRCRCPRRSSRGWALRHRRRIRHMRRRIDSSCRARRTVRIVGQRPEPENLRGRAPTTPPPHRPQGASSSIDERCPSLAAALPRRPPLPELRTILIRVGGGTSLICRDSSTWGSSPQASFVASSYSATCEHRVHELLGPHLG